MRFLHSFVDSMLVVDDSGGVDITDLDDAEAVAVFIAWLHEERKRAKRARNLRDRRRVFHIVAPVVLQRMRERLAEALPGQKT